MTFQPLRKLTDSEANTIRGLMLVGRASISEQFQLIGHLDLVEQDLRSALETLRGCLPPIIYVYGAYGDSWSADKPDTDEYEVVDFKELLGE